MLIKTNMSNDHHDQLFTDMQSPQDNNKINDLHSEEVEQKKSIETEEDEEGLYSSEIENSESKMRGKDLSSREIVEELDRYIIAQPKAKRALAIAVRSRKRRMQLPLWLRKEVTPKNILMRGPSGVGKTEAVRRIANITHCPFIGVPATKFTEVGYIGGDVDSIIKGLVDTAFKRLREEEIEKSMHQVREIAEDRILQAVLANHKQNSSDEMEAGESEDSPLQSLYRKRLQDGLLDEEEITIEVSNQGVGVEIMGPPGMEEMTSQLQNVMQSLNAGRMRSHRLKVKDAIKLVQQEEADKLLNEEELKHKAIEWVEEYGIVFIDEIDKVCRRGDISGSDVSREGVQRDLLPLIEGSSVSTKYGMVRTDHILFITAGAFQSGQKPSDLIPELQGRLPIRVELYPLTAKDFERILTERHASLIAQYKALFETEGVNIQFSEEAIRRIAEIAYLTNEKIENIGARRLYTVMERLLEELSFEASDLVDKEVTIDLTYVNEKLASLFEDEESTHYIL